MSAKELFDSQNSFLKHSHDVESILTEYGDINDDIEYDWHDTSLEVFGWNTSRGDLSSLYKKLSEYGFKRAWLHRHAKKAGLCKCPSVPL